MACYPDLSPCPYFGEAIAPELRAVGWLGRELPYPQGDVPADVALRLREILGAAWQPVRYRGRHKCDWCSFQHSLNLFVPGSAAVYAAPAMIEHYIREHGYAPPREFQEAVLRCPIMGSDAYFDALMKCAPRFMEWARASSPRPLR